MEWGIDVPGHEKACTVGVEKDDGGGKGVVVIDYIGEVGHGFVAFVERGRQGVGVQSCFVRGVDNVDCPLPAVWRERKSISRGSSAKCWISKALTREALLPPIRYALLRASP